MSALGDFLTRLFGDEPVSPVPSDKPKRSMLGSLMDDIFAGAQEPTRIRKEFVPRPTALPTITPRPTRVPTPTATPQPTLNPRNPYSKILVEVFGSNAATMDQVLSWGDQFAGSGHMVDYGGENRGFDPTAENKNEDGSIDRGLFQINENTFKDFMNRKQDLLNRMGIFTYDDMFDPTKNALMASVIFGEQGLRAWFGSQYYRKSR